MYVSFEYWCAEINFKWAIFFFRVFVGINLVVAK